MYKKISKLIVIAKRKEQNMTQEELREMYRERLQREKQTYISKVTQIDSSLLSKFKTGKINLYPHLFVRLEEYLTNQ